MVEDENISKLHSIPDKVVRPTDAKDSSKIFAHPMTYFPDVS